MKLALGGAQFGMNYGATNQDGRPSPEALAAILDCAAKAGLDLIDTAPAYGESEKFIGAQPASQSFRIVTKTPGGNILSENPGALPEQFGQSLALLRRDKVEGLLFHNADVLFAPGGDNLIKAAIRLRESGRVQKIGVSAYDGGQITAILDRFVPDLVQIPLNVFDQRLLRSGALAALKASGVEVHARSAFLQGVLLAPRGTLDARFTGLLPHLERWRAMLEGATVNPLSGALGFLRDNPFVDRIVLGIAKVEQLEEIVTAYSGTPLPGYDELAVDDPSLVDPRFWSPA